MFKRTALNEADRQTGPQLAARHKNPACRGGLSTFLGRHNPSGLAVYPTRKCLGIVQGRGHVGSALRQRVRNGSTEGGKCVPEKGSDQLAAPRGGDVGQAVVEFLCTDRSHLY